MSKKKENIMKIRLEDDALCNAYYDNFPMITYGIESDDIVEMIEAKRKAKGFPTFFDETDPNMWNDGWYNIYIQIDLELKYVVSLWVDVVSNTDKETVPDTDMSYSVRYDSGELIQQIQLELRDKYNTTLEQEYQEQLEVER